MKPEPLSRKEVNHIDVRSFYECRQSLAGRAANLSGLKLGSSINRVIDGRDLKPVFEARQRRLVASLPQPA